MADVQLLLKGLGAVHLGPGQTHLAGLLKVQIQIVQTLLRRGCRQRLAADRLPLGQERGWTDRQTHRNSDRHTDTHRQKP